MEKIDLIDLVVSEIFPLRPSCEKPIGDEGDRKMLRREAHAMIRMLDRAIGKRPSSVRFALLAGHENLICYFYGDQVSHWQYVGNADKYWPEEWDNKALAALGYDVEPQLGKKVSDSTVGKALAKLEAKGKKLLEDKGTNNGQ